ncbi:MAG: hypothetical protein IJ460_03260 [Clostridia bacterium]|nr:hypothetical protein [Clostridia bacterium]
MNEYTKLLKEWCDRIISLQIINEKEPYMHGAVLCPSCGRIHGRFPDSIYPLILLYDELGDEKYLKSARMMTEWAEANLFYDGGYHNDKDAHWPPTSVFAGIALGNTLLHHGKCLPKEDYDRWFGIFSRITDFVYRHFDSPAFKANINYPVTESAHMAMAYVLTGIEKYKEKAIEKMEFSKKYINSDNMLIGEGQPHDTCTAKGCSYIDIGYNAEESIPALIECAHLLGDKKSLEYFAEVFRAVLEFMLPDGAWDNSLGTRAYKWTYWGSRTSDGCQEGIVHIAHLDPVFAEATQRNFELYREHTHDGLLYGGKMLYEAGEEPCVHHTFTHAKSLASMIDADFKYTEKAILPRDREYGIKHIRSTGARLISTGSWRATVAETDAMPYKRWAVSGGVLSVLWHTKAGMILAGTAREYSFLQEATNMQNLRNWFEAKGCGLWVENGEYCSINDIHAVCSHAETEDKITVTARGKLRDVDYNADSDYSFEYIFKKDKVSITVKSEPKNRIVLPIIALKKEFEIISNTHFAVNKNGTKVHIKTDCPMRIEESGFSLVGGFEYAPLTCRGGIQVEISLSNQH